MSTVFELDQDGWDQRVADARLSDPPTHETGFWDNALGATGQSAMKAFARTAQSVGILGGAGMSLYERATDQEGKFTDPYFRDLDEYVNNAVDFWTPDARTTGVAGRVLGGLTETLLPLGVALGNPVPMLMNMQAGTSVDLAREGVDAGTAVGVGAIQSASGALGLKVAPFGKTIPTRVLTGAAGNAAINATTTYAQQQLLEARGYDQLAERYDPLDAEARTIDVLLGAAFGALPHGAPRMQPSQRAAVLAGANARHFQVDTAPGLLKDAAASAAHQRAMETAIQQTLNDEPVSIDPRDIPTVYPKPARDIEETLSAVREVLGDIPEPVAEKVVPQAGTPEFKEFLKREIDTRPMPDIAKLSRDPHAYIAAGDTSTVVPMDKIQLSKAERSGDAAVKRFAAAAAGEIPKRAPIELELDEHGTYHVVDGNGTVTALKKMGINSAVAEVRASESLLKKIDDATPLANLRESLRAAYSKAAQVKPIFDSEVHPLAAEIGTPHAPKIPKALKDPARAAEKVIADYSGDASKLKDLVRATIVIDSPADATAAMDAAKRRFGSPSKARNSLDLAAETIDGYRDINLNFSVRGHTVELQIHVPEMLKAKKAMHALYKERRIIQAKGSELSASDVAQINDLDAQMKTNYEAAWAEVLRRSNISPDTSVPSSRAKLSETGRPSGTSKALTDTPPSGVGMADTGTPPTSQKTGSLPNSGIADSSGEIIAEGGTPAADISQENSAENQAHPPVSVSTAAGRRILVQPKLVELADVITSDNPKFPQELQPRQRGARKALDSQVSDIAKNLDPARLGDSAEADRGAPITGEGNVVESGNGRVMALRHVYESIPEKADAYRAFLESEGYDTKGFKQPVLVRERVTQMSMDERRAFAVEANQAATAALSPVERAQADARTIDAAALSQMRGGEIASLQNAGFVRSFLEHIPTGERNALLNPDGSVSQEGVRRIQAALLAKAYGGKPESNATLGRMLESTDNDMRSAMGALLDAAPAFARLRQSIIDGKVAGEYDISGALTQAIENTAQLRMKGQSLRDYLAQGDMLTARAPIVDDLMKTLFDRTGMRMAGREKIAASLTKYAGQASKQRLDQGSLFAEQPLAPEKLVATAGEEEAAAPKVTDMFGLRTPQAGAVAVAKQALEEADVLVSTGELDAEGNPVTRSGREALAEAESEIVKAEQDAAGYEAAVSCFLTKGFDDAA